MEDLREYINRLRHDFMKMTLDESDVQSDPVQQFEKWFKEAVEGKVHEPNAFVLSTANRDLRPSARILLLRDFGQRGFVFYTNYRSRKGNELAENPYACMTFFWPELERQVRIEGQVIKQSAEESDRYFSFRPRSSRLGAWASPQSEVIPGRDALDQVLSEMEEKFKDSDVLRPEWWGGYVLQPDRIEFWQGRPSRLHDRVVYQNEESGKWHISRLAP